MPQAPDHEGPVGAVPEPAQDHHRHQVDVGADGPAAVPAERDVEIVAQPVRQRDVPASPELGDGPADIGEAEVLQEVEAHHLPQADRHVRVAGEVEVELEHVRDRPRPGERHPHLAAVAEGQVGQGRDRVRQQHLLAQPDQESRHAVGEHLGGMGAVAELILQVLVAQDRPGDELREEGDEGGEVDELRVGARVPAPDVDEVAERLEDVERDADGQDQPPVDAQGRHVGAEQRGEAVHEEVEVLEDAQDAQAARHADPEPDLAARVVAMGIDLLSDQVGEGGGQEQQAEEVDPPPCVEQVGPGQDRVGPEAVRRQVVGRQEERQEQEEEGLGREHHGSALAHLGTVERGQEGRRHAVEVE